MKKTKSNATRPLRWIEARKVMLFLENEKDYHHLLIVSIGFYTGYRITDILSLKYSDFKGEYLDITERKTSKQRAVKIIDELRRIVTLCQTALKKKDKHFIFTRMRFNSDKPISTEAGIERIAKALTKAGVQAKKKTGHVLRKTFALRYFELAKEAVGEERALIELSDMLNHASKKVTRMYLGLSEQVQQDIFDSFA